MKKLQIHHYQYFDDSAVYDHGKYKTFSPDAEQIDIDILYAVDLKTEIKKRPDNFGIYCQDCHEQIEWHKKENVGVTISIMKSEMEQIAESSRFVHSDSKAKTIESIQKVLSDIGIICMSIPRNSTSFLPLWDCHCQILRELGDYKNSDRDVLREGSELDIRDMFA